MATGRPCFPGQIGKLRRAVLDDGDDRGAPRDRRRLRRVHGRRRRALHEGAQRSGCARPPPRWTTRPRRSTATSSAPSRPCSSKSALVLASDDGRRPVRHRRGRTRGRRAALRDPRRPRARCAGDDDREGDRHLRRRPRRAGAAARVRRCRGMRHPARRCSCRRCPTTRPISRCGCASGAGKQGRDRRSPSAGSKRRADADRDPQRAAGAHPAQDAAHQRLRRAHPGAHRSAGGARPRPRRRCASSASTSRTSAARTSSPRWWCSRTACRARTSTARSASPRRPTTPTRCTRCSCGGSRTSTVRRSTAEPTPAGHRDDGDGRRRRARPRFAYPPQLLVVDGGKPQVEAAARALRDAGHTEIALCGIAKRLEEVWLPGEEFPVILPRTSEALYLLQRLRDEAHRFAITHQRKKRASATSRRVLAEVPGLGDVAHQGAAASHFGSVTALRAATPERDRRGAGNRSRAGGRTSTRHLSSR